MGEMRRENESGQPGLPKHCRDQPAAEAALVLVFGRWRLSLAATVTALVIWYLLCILSKKRAADLDFWGYLAFGRLIWETGAFPYQDVYTYLPTRPLWVYHEWLTGMLYYPIYKWLGGWALQLLRLTLALATVGLLAAAARRRGAEFWGIILAILAASGFLAFGYAPVRAQIFTYFFFALTLYLLERARWEQKWQLLWWLVPVQLLWCNLHGGFLAGLGLIGLYAAGELLGRRPWWPYAACLLPATLITLINPYGWHYWIYLAEAITMPRPEITEWVSILGAWTQKLHRPTVIYLVVLLVFTACLFYLTARPEPTASLALLVTLLAGVKHIRHLVFFYLLLAVYTAPLLSRYLQGMSRRPGWQRLRFWLLQSPRQPGRWILVGLALVFLWQLGRHPWWQLTVPACPQHRLDQLYYPVGAVAWLKEQGYQGKLLTTYNWGEFLLWELYPAFRVGLDGRYETVYPAAVHRPYMNFLYACPGWEEFLASYPPDFILLEKQEKIAQLLQAHPAWQVLYQDEISIILAPVAAEVKMAGQY